ncbi:ABC transporter permease [Corynebacterium singulare]|uniref:Uncharacterized protein n=1 Tax=Corynebacterium singulare TaxID=161899 RepID=A0A0B6F4C3_9CORY|nr:hypothetical protein [Corynebacterium singulare]AJI78891.1 hypothetical protein CSING_06795 [Corynebacterium singulare]
MTHSPIRLPRTKLKISDKARAYLAPEESQTHDSQPNREIDRSGIREVIDSTGLPPSRAKASDVLAGLFIGFFGVTAAFLALIFGFVIFISAGSDEGDSSGIVHGFLICGALAVVFVGLAILVVRSEKRSSKRTSIAWKNGWIEYRPALIGELVLHRRRRNDDSTDHYYKAPLLILQPDGSMPKAWCAEFVSANPNWLKMRGFTVADGPLVATVDFNHNNGWHVVAYRADDPNPTSALQHGLSKEQMEAVLTFAENSWVK